MDKLETIGNTPEGNTRTSGGRVVPSKYWCFTYFHAENELEQLETILKSLGNYYFGEEICPTTGKKHLQGFMQFSSKTRPSEAVKIKAIHWEKAKASVEQNIAYCGKEGKIHTNMKIPKPLKDPLQGLELYPFQKDILELIKTEPDPRKIHWYWEEEGNAGKTALCKHICMHHNALMLGGKGADIKFGMVEHINKHKEIDIAIFHLTRTVEEYVSYEALESIKDGILFSGKYESGQLIFNTPHVIVFANFAPDTTKLSKDRWVTKRIKKPL